MVLRRRYLKLFSPNASALLLSLIVMALILSGCKLLEGVTGSNTASDTRPDDGKPENTSTASIEPSDNRISGTCTNDYYPVDPNLTRRYEITGSGPSKYTLTQRDVTNDGFVEDRDFESGIKITNNWICTEEGLRTAEFTNTGVMQSGRFSMETVKSTGVTIPKQPVAGSEFDASYDVKVKVKAGPVSADATGDVQVANKIVSVGESLEVRGKTFETVRIDSTIKVTIEMRGRKIEGATVTVSNWYSKEAGLVKQETGGTFGRQLLEIVALETK